MTLPHSHPLSQRPLPAPKSPRPPPRRYAAANPWGLQPSDLQRSAATADSELKWYGVGFLKQKPM